MYLSKEKCSQSKEHEFIHWLEQRYTKIFTYKTLGALRRLNSQDFLCKWKDAAERDALFEYGKSLAILRLLFQPNSIACCKSLPSLGAISYSCIRVSSLSGAIKKFVAYVGIEIKGKECEKTN